MKCLPASLTNQSPGQSECEGRNGRIPLICGPEDGFGRKSDGKRPLLHGLRGQRRRAVVQGMDMAMDMRTGHGVDPSPKARYCANGRGKRSSRPGLGGQADQDPGYRPRGRAAGKLHASHGWAPCRSDDGVGGNRYVAFAVRARDAFTNGTAGPPSLGDPRNRCAGRRGRREWCSARCGRLRIDRRSPGPRACWA